MNSLLRSFFGISLFCLLVIPAATFAQENLLVNGDFEDDLSGWEAVEVTTFQQYPTIDVKGSHHCPPGYDWTDHFFLDVPNGSDGYVQQTVTLPEEPVELTFLTWGNLDPVTATVSVIDNLGIEVVLDTYTPVPTEVEGACSGSSPVEKSYDLSEFAGEVVTLRLRATSDNGIGTFANWDDVTIAVPSELELIQPTGGDFLLAGRPYKIKWERSSVVETVNVLFFPDTTGSPFETLILAFDNDSLLWTPPATTFSRSARIAVVDATNPTIADTSGFLSIKPYHLTRLTENGEFEPFDVLRHGWSFGNTQADLFPQDTWWSLPQFDYTNGEDPFTEDDYDSSFPNPPINASPNVFPDWLSVVHAYGTDNAYWSIIEDFDFHYQSAFTSFWGNYHGGTGWGGSCAGMSLTSLLSFGHREAFEGLLSSLENVDELFDLTMGAEERTVINRLHVYWKARVQKDYRTAVDFSSQTPQDVLAHMKARFLSHDRDKDAYLYISNVGGSGAHAVVPYALDRDPADTTKWKVFVYDPNKPSNNLAFVSLDSTANSWSYNGFTPAWGGATGMALVDPISNYLETAIPPYLSADLPEDAQAKNGSEDLYVAVSKGAHVSITSPEIAGSVGFADSVAFNTMAAAVPDIPPVGGYTPPIGYQLAEADYMLEVGSADSVINIGFVSESYIYSFGRRGTNASETDRLFFDGGLSVFNPDNDKPATMRAIAPRFGEERAYELANVTLSHSDSMRIDIVADTELSLQNFGQSKTYDLKLTYNGRSFARIFENAAVMMDAGAAHRIRPDWDNLIDQPVEILIDHENDGAVDDTLFLVNTSTDLGAGPNLPESTFGLAQNYPNPFATTTTIPYSIEHAGHVSLIVYDILGREVQRIVDRRHSPGNHSATLHGKDLPGGMYFYKLTTEAGTTTRTMVVL